MNDQDQIISLQIPATLRDRLDDLVVSLNSGPSMTRATLSSVIRSFIERGLAEIDLACARPPGTPE